MTDNEGRTSVDAVGILDEILAAPIGLPGGEAAVR